MSKLVKCTDCKYFKKMYIWTLENIEKIPEQCRGCYPYDFEDERSINIRKYFDPEAQNI